MKIVTISTAISGEINKQTIPTTSRGQRESCMASSSQLSEKETQRRVIKRGFKSAFVGSNRTFERVLQYRISHTFIEKVESKFSLRIALA